MYRACDVLATVATFNTTIPTSTVAALSSSISPTTISSRHGGAAVATSAPALALARVGAASLPSASSALSVASLGSVTSQWPASWCQPSPPRWPRRQPGHS